MAFIPGLMLGFFGSVHCIGMCGPLVLAMPAGTVGRFRFVVDRLIYNLGRVVTYVAFGALLGFAGAAVRMPGFQQAVSIAAGVSIVLLVLLPQIGRPALSSFAPVARLGATLTSGIGRLITRTSLPSLFGLGLLNGLLPCGFVYLAIAGALAAGSMVAGMTFMAGFGVGTVPAMLSVSLFPRLVSQSVRQKAVRLLPVFTVLVGLLLILRGLNLGIPYVSPKLSPPASQTEEAPCH